MKRLWIGVGLLVAILVLGFWSSKRMEEIHTQIRDTLLDSAQAAGEGRWERADELAQKAGEDWQKGWSFSAAFADHTVLDEIDGLLAQAEIYRQSRDAVRYGAICARMASAVEALQEAHRLSWRNLL